MLLHSAYEREVGSALQRPRELVLHIPVDARISLPFGLGMRLRLVDDTRIDSSSCGEVFAW